MPTGFRFRSLGRYRPERGINTNVDRGYVAKRSIAINAPIAHVWDALVNPATIKQYMFGADAVSEWNEGSQIVFRGEWEGKEYEDKGVILRFEPERILQYTHFSPLSGLPDTPENYHTVTLELTGNGEQTQLSLSQDNNPTEKARAHSEKNWATMLSNLKRLLEEHRTIPAPIFPTPGGPERMRRRP